MLGQPPDDRTLAGRPALRPQNTGDKLRSSKYAQASSASSPCSAARTLHQTTTTSSLTLTVPSCTTFAHSLLQPGCDLSDTRSNWPPAKDDVNFRQGLADFVISSTTSPIPSRVPGRRPSQSSPLIVRSHRSSLGRWDGPLTEGHGSVRARQNDGSIGTAVIPKVLLPVVVQPIPTNHGRLLRALGNAAVRHVNRGDAPHRHAPSDRSRTVRRTPGISCEAVPASMPLTGAGMRRHVHPGNHAAESFVSFIPLFGRPRRIPSRRRLLAAVGRLAVADDQLQP